MSRTGRKGDEGRVEGKVFRGKMEGGGEMFCRSLSIQLASLAGNGGECGRLGGLNTRHVAYPEGLWGCHGK